MSAPSKKIRALIVDDEELARHVVRELLQSHPEVEILAECANGFEAAKAFAEHQPDLIFLDVQMPKLTGFDVLELIGDRKSTRLNSSHTVISYAVFCLKKKKKQNNKHLTLL